jgi:hypothetical protein
MGIAVDDVLEMAEQTRFDRMAAGERPLAGQERTFSTYLKHP